MDSTTMIFALALGNLTLCAALFFHGLEQRREPKGDAPASALGIFTSARQLQAGAWLLLYFRGSGLVPDPIAIPLGYSLLFAGIVQEAGALFELVGRGAGAHAGQGVRTRWRRVAYPAVALAIAAFVACYVLDPFGLRVVAGALVIGACYLALGVALARRWRDATMLRRSLALAIGLLALVVGARGALVLLMPGGWGWLSNTLLQALSVHALYLLMLLGGFGYLLLAREDLQDDLARLAVLDTVTDCPNRRGLFGLLAPWLALARRPGLPTALVLLDLDHFKRINDDYGHAAGDVALRAVVEVCRRHLRDSDQVGRLAGAEFALLLPRTSQADALVVAERIRAAIEAAPVKLERALVKLTASMGVTELRADDTNVSLFNRAELALRAAKGQGRNTIAQASHSGPDA